MSDEAPQTPTPEAVGNAVHGGFQAIAAALEHIASRFSAPSPFLANLIEQIRGHAGTVAASLPQPEPTPEQVAEPEPETRPESAQPSELQPNPVVTSGGWSDPNATPATQP